MREVVIAGYLRTGQSRSRPDDPAKDWFCKMRGDELLARLLPELIKKTRIEAKEIDDFIVASSKGVGEQWTWGGRIPLFLANLPETIAAKFVDQQCGSAMASVHVGYMEIAQGFADIVMVAGMEHMTRLPMGKDGPITQRGVIVANQSLFLDSSLAHWGMATAMNAGLTAEKLSSQTDITKEEMDLWAVRSHTRAAKAYEEGFFYDEIMPIPAEQDGGTVMIVDKDQSVRDDATMEAMAKLKPAYKKNGVITAGNSSPLNAGVSGMILMDKEVAEKKGINPLASIRSIGFVGVDPTIMGCGPVPASRKALQKAGLRPDDIDYWEINEAFSIVTLNCIKELGIDEERVNVMGGAIALGHPLGATGIRLVGTLARILQNRNGRFGCANACVGGGQGVATIIEREQCV